MIIRTGPKSDPNRVRIIPNRDRTEPVRNPVEEYRCEHGFYTPTRIIYRFGREIEIPGDGRCPH